MKKIIFAMVAAAIFLVSCEKPEVKEFEYEKNPNYTWGYVEFWGDYYADYQITNNVLSLSLFTDSLDVDQDGNLTGFGQYLYLEDVFVAPADTILPVGTFSINGNADVFTIAPGEEYEYEGDKYDGGAMIYYVEKDESKSTMKYIKSGTMAVSASGLNTEITCSFILEDDTELKGTFKSQLPHFDQSEMYEIIRQKVGRSTMKKVRSSRDF